MICLGLEIDQIDDAHGTPLPGGPRPARARADNAARARIRATAAILGGSHRGVDGGSMMRSATL